MKHEDQINNWFANFDKRFHSAVPTIVSDTAIEFFKDRFHPSNMDWDGVKWQALSPKTIKRKVNKGRILYEKSNLLDSITEKQKTMNRVVISAGNITAPYARIHNEGLRVRGYRYVKPFHNKNFMGTGSRVQIKGHTRKVDYKMPKRQFMGHSPYLNRILIDNLTEFFNKK